MSRSRHDRHLLNYEFECRSKPSRFSFAAFYTVHLNSLLITKFPVFRKPHLFWLDFSGLGSETAALVVPGCPADAATHVFWIMRLTAVNCFRSRLHRSSWSSPRQTRATASRMSSSSFKHNTQVHTHFQHLKMQSVIIYSPSLFQTWCFFSWQCYFSIVYILLWYLFIY